MLGTIFLAIKPDRECFDPSYLFSSKACSRKNVNFCDSFVPFVPINWNVISSLIPFFLNELIIYRPIQFLPIQSKLVLTYFRRITFAFKLVCDPICFISENLISAFPAFQHLLNPFLPNKLLSVTKFSNQIIYDLNVFR